MLKRSEKNALYCISNFKSKKLLIIDQISQRKVKTIELPVYPFNIVQDNENIYVSSISGSIAIINKYSYEYEVFNVENNGCIAIDKKYKRIYISNVSEVYVYDLILKKRIAVVKGFGIVDNLKIDDSKEKIFIIDILKRKLSVYDLKNINKLDEIKNIGTKSSDIQLCEDKIYISNRGGVDKSSGNITCINQDNKKIKTIDMVINSSITKLILKNDILYALNLGLNRIELINIKSNTLERNINIKNPMNMILANNKIVAVGKSGRNKTILTFYDINTDEIENIELNEEYGIPNNIILLEKYNESSIVNIDVNEVALEKVENKLQGIEIKEYIETIKIKNILVEMPKQYIYPVTVENIIFNMGYIVKGSEIIENINNIIKIKFKLRLPYKIVVQDKLGKVNTVRKFIEVKKAIEVDSICDKNCNDIKIRMITKNLKLEKIQVIKDIITFSLSFNIKLRFIIDGCYENIINIKNQLHKLE